MQREKQIEELAKDIDEVIEFTVLGIYDGFTKVRVACERLAEKIYNAGYRKQNEWISVEERLPEDGVRVLTACDDGIVRLNISKGGFPSVLNEQHRFSNVTHWMPLPEAPKMTRKEDEGK